MNNIETLKLALEALEDLGMKHYESTGEVLYKKTFNALRQAVEQAQQAQPVAWQERQARRMRDGVVTEWTDWYPCRYRTIDEARAEACDHIPYEWRPLYTAPPPRKPEQLTDEQKKELIKKSELWDMHIHIGWYSAPAKSFVEKATQFIADIEAAHGIKENT